MASRKELEGARRASFEQESQHHQDQLQQQHQLLQKKLLQQHQQQQLRHHVERETGGPGFEPEIQVSSKRTIDDVVEQNLSTKKVRPFEQNRCIACGESFRSSLDLQDHLSGSGSGSRSCGAGPGNPGCLIRRCFMCDFLPPSDLGLDDGYRCLQDHVITAHFKVGSV